MALDEIIAEMAGRIESVVDDGKEIDPGEFLKTVSVNPAGPNYRAFMSFVEHYANLHAGMRKAEMDDTIIHRNAIMAGANYVALCMLFPTIFHSYSVKTIMIALATGAIGYGLHYIKNKNKNARIYKIMESFEERREKIIAKFKESIVPVQQE